MDANQINTERISLPIYPKKRPIISYWKSGDPCLKLNYLQSKLTDINIINTKNLSDDFISAG